MVREVNYWDGKVALICSVCEHYTAFGSIEGLRQHLKVKHGKAYWEAKATAQTEEEGVPDGRNKDR